MGDFKVGDKVRFREGQSRVFTVLAVGMLEGGLKLQCDSELDHVRSAPAEWVEHVPVHEITGPTPKAPGYWSMTKFAPGDLSGVQREMNAFTEKIQAVHAKVTAALEADMAPHFYGPSEDAKRDRILPALRKIVAEWSPAEGYDAVVRALNDDEISLAEARELLGMSPAVEVPEGMSSDDELETWECPRNGNHGFWIKGEPCAACLRFEDGSYVPGELERQLASERQRASRLADECGHLRARFDASEGQLSAAYEGIATLESDLRVARRTIQRLRDQIIKLGARPV